MTARGGSDDVAEKFPQVDEPHLEGCFPIGTGRLYYREFGPGDNVLIGLHGSQGHFKTTSARSLI